MPDTEQPRRPADQTIVPPDAKKESEITDYFDFGSAQVKSPRHEQQDYCTIAFPLVGDDYLVALVADGISSLKRAAEASRLAGESFVTKVREQIEDGVPNLKRVVGAINVDLVAESRRRIRELEREAVGTGQDSVDFESSAFYYETGMSTTFTGIVIKDGRVWLAHLGDSRLYMLSHGLLTQMTTDETVAEESRGRGETDIDPQCEDTLTNWLGDEDAEPVLDEYEAVAGDVWLLVSDGVVKVLSDEELRNILSQQKDAQSLANDIIEAVKSKGVVDDTTAVVVKVK